GLIARPFPGRAPAGFSLPNPNHAAALIAALAPTVMVAAARAMGPAAVGLWALVGGANVALAFTGSRAGILVGFAAEAATLVILVRARLVRVQAWAVGASTVLVVLAGTALWTRFGESGPHGRLAIWRAALPLVGDHWLFGVGGGAFDLA